MNQSICPVCNTPFPRTRSTQVYCGIPCRKRMERKLVAVRARGTETISGHKAAVHWSPTLEQLAAHAHSLVAGIVLGPLLFAGDVPKWEAPPNVGFAWEPEPTPGYWVMRLQEMDIMDLVRLGNGEVTIR